jgi:hypothetical protein
MTIQNLADREQVSQLMIVEIEKESSCKNEKCRMQELLEYQQSDA